jgi:2-oxoglutarate dehydrogenase E2 component (dihydrolipoamide succinyltransferase)
MVTKIVVPALGESVVEATVAKWLKREGEPVTQGEPIVELETDKVNLSVSAEKAGVLSHIERTEGEDVTVGDVLGTVDETKQSLALGSSVPPSEAAAPPAASVREKTAPKTDGAAGATHEALGAAVSRAGEPVPAAAEAAHKATTLAQRIAAAQGVDVAQVEGSGPGGRVTKDDVQQFLTQRTERPVGGMEPEPAAKPAAAPPVPAGEARREERQRLSRRRQTIARRLVEAQHTAAMLTTFNEVDMSAIIEIRKRRKESFAEKHGIKLGFVSFFVKASIGALKAYPRLNAEIQDTDIVLKHYYDIGVAIGAEEGLVVPVLRDADRMTFAEIERAIDNYVQKTRDGSLSIDDLRGGTFTITNGGVFGSLLSTPILNPPQVGILGLHKIQERPIARGGEVVIRSMMYVALSYDHRIVDGREAVLFLVHLKELIEDPESLLLEG